MLSLRVLKMKEKFTIMLVEDNPAHAELIIRSIKRLDFVGEVIHLEDGEVVLDYLSNAGTFNNRIKYKRPQLILLDLRLPKIDGLDVLIEIKKHSDLLDIPVVVLTTSDAENDKLKAYQNHVNSYLVKPIEFSSFGKLLADLSEYWLRWNKRPREIPSN
jgi:two-component system response regulator